MADSIETGDLKKYHFDAWTITASNGAKTRVVRLKKDGVNDIIRTDFTSEDTGEIDSASINHLLNKLK